MHPSIPGNSWTSHSGSRETEPRIVFSRMKPPRNARARHRSTSIASGVLCFDNNMPSCLVGKKRPNSRDRWHTSYETGMPNYLCPRWSCRTRWSCRRHARLRASRPTGWTLSSSSCQPHPAWPLALVVGAPQQPCWQDHLVSTVIEWKGSISGLSTLGKSKLIKVCLPPWSSSFARTEALIIALLSIGHCKWRVASSTILMHLLSANNALFSFWVHLVSRSTAENCKSRVCTILHLPRRVRNYSFFKKKNLSTKVESERSKQRQSRKNEWCRLVMLPVRIEMQ